MSLAPQAIGTREITQETAGKSAPERTESSGVVSDSVTVSGTVIGGHRVLVDESDLHLLEGPGWSIKRARSGARYVQHIWGPRESRQVAMLHRIVTGAQPDEIVDHINGNGLDNRRANLRLTNPRGNSMNVTRSKNQKRGGYKGVSWHKAAGKWEAGICAGELRSCGRRKRIHLGLFDDAVVAAKAYDRAARHYFGEYAAPNFPEEHILDATEAGR